MEGGEGLAQSEAGGNGFVSQNGGMKNGRMKEWKKRREGRGSALGISAAIAVFGDSAIGGELFLGDALGAGQLRDLLR